MSGRNDRVTLKVAGLTIDICGYAYADADNYHDANWYRVAAICEAPGASVKVTGAILTAPHVFGFADELRELIENSSGSANLSSFEPNLHVSIKLSKTGTGSCTVDITPDSLCQTHQFIFTIDQTFLKPLLHGCEEVLQRYPVRLK